MALLNITKLENVVPPDIYDFRSSNMNIRISTESLIISELNITEQEWLGNF